MYIHILEHDTVYPITAGLYNKIFSTQFNEIESLIVYNTLKQQYAKDPVLYSKILVYHTNVDLGALYKDRLKEPIDSFVIASEDLEAIVQYLGNA